MVFFYMIFYFLMILLISYMTFIGFQSGSKYFRRQKRINEVIDKYEKLRESRREILVLIKTKQ